jgi:ribonuclease VapC
MILDTSAVVSVFLKDEDHKDVLDKLLNAKAIAIGSPTLAETGIVLSAKIGNGSASLLFRFLQENGVFIVSFGPDHYIAAVHAYEKYGKGRHKAGLNFGDCLTYAVAKLAKQPLLFVGKDFSHTDLEIA